ncbi:MAG: hypothetical protein MUO43_02395 [Desulfobacterales bacterium]|nr:hypothetical protein [Desulfobacterales bacterium]
MAGKAGKPCAKCGKNLGWLSQNKIEGIIYCEDCWKELKQEKIGPAKKLKAEKKEAKKKLKAEKKAKKGAAINIREIFSDEKRIILFVTAAILALILLFPPFHTVYKGIDINSGYNFILNPPTAPITDLEIKILSNINMALLFVQYLFTVTIGGILWFVFKKDNSSSTKEQRPEQRSVNSRVVE